MQYIIYSLSKYIRCSVFLFQKGTVDDDEDNDSATMTTMTMTMTRMMMMMMMMVVVMVMVMVTMVTMKRVMMETVEW